MLYAERHLNVGGDEGLSFLFQWCVCERARQEIQQSRSHAPLVGEPSLKRGYSLLLLLLLLLKARLLSSNGPRRHAQKAPPCRLL